MWNMTIYKCKLKISRLEGETFLSLTENKSYCSKIVDEHQQKSLRLAHKIVSVGLVETNNVIYA